MPDKGAPPPPPPDIGGIRDDALVVPLRSLWVAFWGWLFGKRQRTTPDLVPQYCHDRRVIVCEGPLTPADLGSVSV